MSMTFGKGFAPCAALALFFWAAPVRADAQGIAASLDELRFLLRAGDTVTVIDNAGNRSIGRIAVLSSTSLVLMVAGDKRNLLEREIAEIHMRRRDSLQNGELIGFGVGAAGGLALGLSKASELGPWLPGVPLFYGAIGMGIGAAVDAMISGTRVIYARRPQRVTLTIIPLMTRDRRGILVSVGLARPSN